MQPSRFLLSMLLIATFTVIVPSPVHAQDLLNIDILHVFTASPDGASPNPLIRDAKGNLYGTTASGGFLGCPPGVGGCGIVYEVANDGTYTILYSFQGGSDDGGLPISGVTRDPAGNLFGTTGGVNGSPSTIYEITSGGDEKILRYLGNSNFADGAAANSAPILDSNGNLFGNISYGGDPSCGFNGNGCGVVYEVQANGKFRVLYTFTSLADGIEPISSPVIDSQGNLFGTAGLGGDLTCDHPDGCGLVYELDHTGKYRILHKFTGKADGAFVDCVIDDGAGKLVGVTEQGGDLSCYPPLGCGTIFRIDEAGSLKILHTFAPFTKNDIGHSCLVRDSKGNLYGTNAIGGTHNAGLLYELDTAGKFKVLYDFPISNSSQGGVPIGVAPGPEGEFFGVNTLGGDTNCGVENSGCGTVWKLTP
jgi:uncharacterized repeat protein (TIGR03803 family)